ncbi:AsmA family protein [Stutzerimonas tarimensis]|uniref:AsmA family protein n=1 Tax=Stutzerimonas tarimensis TaxID=1507735 RepID=A0ABV7T7F5_9GAMM
MKALGKILGLVLLGLLLIIVALGFALTHLFDPNDYKDEIQQLARERAGLDLAIGGDIGWSLFPWLGLELHDTSLASVATPEQPLANVRMLGLSVRVMPLLRREVQMSDISINGLNLTLVRDAQGRGNWEGIGQPEGAAARAPAEPAEPSPDGQRRPVALDIDSLTVRDARVSYQDASTGQHLSAESIELSTGAIREDTPVDIQLKAFFGVNQPVVRARSELRATLHLDTGAQGYRLEDLRLNGEASGEPFDGQTLNFSAQGELLADLASQQAEWRNLRFSANELRGLGELRVENLDSVPRFNGTLSVARFDLAAFLRGIGQTLPEMADSTALGNVELVSKITGSQNSLALEDLDLKLDGSQLRGRIAVTDLSAQALRVNLTGDRLDLDRYLPPPSEEQQAATAARDSEVQTEAILAGGGTTPLPEQPTRHAWSEEPVLPLDRLRQLDVRLDLGLNELTVARLPLQKFSLKARGAGGQLQLEELRGGLYGGQVNTSANLDLRPAVPLLTLRQRIAEVAVEQLLEAQNEQVVVQGRLTLDANLRTRGNSQRAWVDALAGDISFNIANGVLVEANLEEQICRAIALLNQRELTTQPSGRDTPFRQLGGSLTLQDGVASNRDLRASIPGLTVNGRGDVDLRVLGMDYRIGVVIEGDKSDMPDPACQVSQRYVGLEWPLHCRGPLELGARACRIDQSGLGQIAARLAGDKLNEKLQEQLGDRVSPELQEALRGLFRR